MKKILVVSQEVPVQERLKKELVGDGYDVIVANAGEDAVDQCMGENPDLVLVDTVLSGMDNVMAIDRLRAENLPFPILVWSTYSPGCDESPWWTPAAHVLRTPSFLRVKEKIRELCAWA